MRRLTVPRPALAALASLATLAAAAAPWSPAAAQIAPGSTLVFSGTADATELGSPGVLLDFAKHLTASQTANTGAFASFNVPGRGANGAARGFMEPIVVGNGPQPVDRLLHFGGFTFDLAFLPSGGYGQDDCYVMPEVGQRCTPYQLPSYELSPFYLENVAASGPDAFFTALVSFDMVGTVTGRGTTTDFRGTITATFEGLSYQEALMGLEQYGLRDVAFTGTFVAGPATVELQAATLAATEASVVPEPGTVGLVGIGLAGLAAAARRRRARDARPTA